VVTGVDLELQEMGGARDARVVVADGLLAAERQTLVGEIEAAARHRLQVLLVAWFCEVGGRILAARIARLSWSRRRGCTLASASRIIISARSRSTPSMGSAAARSACEGSERFTSRRVAVTGGPPAAAPPPGTGRAADMG
jgi:hypothetical protein